MPIGAFVYCFCNVKALNLEYKKSHNFSSSGNTLVLHYWRNEDGRYLREGRPTNDLELRYSNRVGDVEI